MAMVTTNENSIGKQQIVGESAKVLPALATVTPVKKRQGKHRQHELVGVRIRKRFKDGSWCNGIVKYVKEKAKVIFANQRREYLPLDETFEMWRISYQMYKLPSVLSFKRAPRLFPRGRNSKPYTLEQFMGLIQYIEQSHGGATIEEMEASHLVRKKPGTKNTEVYGRMLPCATHVGSS